MELNGLDGRHRRRAKAIVRRSDQSVRIVKGRLKAKTPLDISAGQVKLRAISGVFGWSLQLAFLPDIMTSIPAPKSPDPSVARPCQHPRVQVVSRDEEAEFVECLDCREVFDSSEFKDMSIEEKELADEE
jgi:hypothetical protein